MKLICFLLCAVPFSAWAQPVITRHPTNYFVSLGANPAFRVTATTTAPPLRYQWRFNDVALEGRTNNSLTLTNVQLAVAGDYAVVITDTSGSITSRVAHLDVDPTFTKITTGPVVTSGGFSFSTSWGDYDDDGFVDLYVCNWPEASGTQRDFLYRNNGDATFTRITSGPPVTANRWAAGAAWGDYDNDGQLDLFVSRPGSQSVGHLTPNTLYHQESDGRFTRILSGLIVTESMHSHSGTWGDFNKDGWLDLVAVNFGSTTTTAARGNYLYLNLGNGTFDPVSFGPKSLSNGDSWNASAADFNNDGWLDLFIANGGVISRQTNELYFNNGTGSLFRQTSGAIVTASEYSVACAWGDYDNDGDLDLFVTNFYGENNTLYRNDGPGGFTLAGDSVVATPAGCSVGCAWGDYDNDGWVDLFVGNLGPVPKDDGPHLSDENNFLYHNNQDGTFTRVTTGSLANDLGYSTGCAWADYDNDGFLDLVVANGWVTAGQNEFLYRNNGNTNSWITFRLMGTVSNRSAIGAKVRVQAASNGQTLWQMRELSGGSNYGSQNDLRAHFGLGGATKVERVRIEWPSGAVTEMRDVGVKQFLTIVEPAQLAGVTRAVGTAKIALRGGAGFSYALDASPDLGTWLPLRTNTAIGLSLEFEDAEASNHPRRFYRARLVNP